MSEYKDSFSIIKVDVEKTFELSSNNSTILSALSEEFISIFMEVKEDKNVLQILQYYNSNLYNRISKFAEKHISDHPQLNALIAFFRGFADNEPFYIIPDNHLKFDQKDKIRLINYLLSIIEKRPFEEVQSETDELFGVLLNNYTIGSAGRKKANIGNKQDRTCRFCFRSENEGAKFENRAHAISEGLGNKSVILYEECDSCNDEFSMSIEPDLIKYLGLFRTFFGIKGNGGTKQFKGDNFSIVKEEAINLSYISDNETPEVETDFKFSLSAGLINYQNIYKTLCKFFISVLPNKYLSDFEETVKWIKGINLTEKLPVIAECLTYDFFSEQPMLNYYIRKNNNYELPYAIGEFHFACKVIIFIIPFSKHDNIDFSDKENYQAFWVSESFKHFSTRNSWSFTNFSRNKSQDFKIQINMEPNHLSK